MNASKAAKGVVELMSRTPVKPSGNFYLYWWSGFEEAADLIGVKEP